MKIVFFGTPDFAVPSLQKLQESNHEIVAVVTAPDKERGRGRKVSFTPVKEYALENNLALLQPENLNDDNFVELLKNLHADLFIIVAFRILPSKIYKIPQFGSFNLHGSLLPKYRGAAPIQWAIIKGDNLTGVTTFFLEDKVDTGNIIACKEFVIKETDNFGIIYNSLCEIGAKLVLETVEMIEQNKILTKTQDNTLASPAPKITKEICKIDWNKKAVEINNLVRGLSPYPCAYFTLGEKIYKVFETKIRDYQNLAIGKFLQTQKELLVGCNEGTIEIIEIQPEGKKRMNVLDFLRGNRIEN